MGYKMKKFSGFKNSPAKISDSEVVGAQRRLNKIEGSYRAPGWQHAASSIHQTLRTGGLKSGGTGRSDVAEDIYDRPTGGGTAAGGGGGGGNKSVGSTLSEMKQVTGDAKGLMQEVKDIGKGFGDLFKGASKSADGGGGTGGGANFGNASLMDKADFPNIYGGGTP